VLIVLMLVGDDGGDDASHGSSVFVSVHQKWLQEILACVAVIIVHASAVLIPPTET
jgi:hypothetical protein